MKRILTTLTLLTAAAPLFTGCQTKPNSASCCVVVTPAQIERENREHVALLGRRVQNSIACEALQLHPMPDGRLEVTANLRNLEARRIQVQVNCVFKDEQGFAHGDETPFADVILTENAVEPVRFVSMNDKAKRYTIQVREAR